jgi:Fur family transcriptional regulator, peroxide stress response regulator
LDTLISPIENRRRVTETLKQLGLRLTPQRIELLKVLEKLGHTHPSFSEIYETVKKRYSNVSESTILKNLTALGEIGMVQRFSYNGETRFELNPRPHVNFVDSTGAIVDVESPEVTRLVVRLAELVNSSTGVKTKHILILAE